VNDGTLGVGRSCRFYVGIACRNFPKQAEEVITYISFNTVLLKYGLLFIADYVIELLVVCTR
jgi:hypothetical protein